MVTANGEIIAGISLLLMGLIFLGAGTVNETWRAMMIPDLVIVAMGASTLGLGIWTIKYEEKHHVSSHHH